MCFAWLSVGSSFCISRFVIPFKQLFVINHFLETTKQKTFCTKCETRDNKKNVQKPASASVIGWCQHKMCAWVCVCVCVCVWVCVGVCVCVCVSLNTCPFPLSLQPPPVPGSAQQLQERSLQQWCPSTTHYLEGFSLSRCYCTKNGVKLRPKERLVSIGSVSHPLFMISYRITAEGSVGLEGGRLDVPRVWFTHCQS